MAGVSGRWWWGKPHLRVYMGIGGCITGTTPSLVDGQNGGRVLLDFLPTHNLHGNPTKFQTCRAVVCCPHPRGCLQFKPAPLRASLCGRPPNYPLPRGGGSGWGQGYKFQKTSYAFAWFGKSAIYIHHPRYPVCKCGTRQRLHGKPRRSIAVALAHGQGENFRAALVGVVVGVIEVAVQQRAGFRAVAQPFLHAPGQLALPVGR